MTNRQAGWKFGVKRAFDTACSALLLLLVSPVLAVVALAVLCSMGAPVLFRQVRPGKHGQPFTLLKFRTMREQEPGGPSATDEARLTELGKVLRTTSLDELPQLLTVLRGDMSLVGPRPLLTQYLDRYTPEQARRHEVLPGITGWTQVNGRNALEWKQKFELDVWYVDHWSLALDFKILVLTLWRVATTNGISSDGHATMPEFLGNPK